MPWISRDLESPEVVHIWREKPERDSFGAFFGWVDKSVRVDYIVSGHIPDPGECEEISGYKIAVWLFPVKGES